MDDKRKQLILKEIYFWKENNMLPEQYCNYLINLYTEGDDTLIEKVVEKRRFFDLELILSFLFLLLVLIGLIITYHTDIPFEMQTLYFMISLFILFGSLYFYKRKSLNPIIIYISMALFLLLFTIQIGETFFQNQPLFLLFSIMFNGLIWIIFGMIRRHWFFKIVGGLTISVIVYISIKNYIA